MKLREFLIPLFVVTLSFLLLSNRASSSPFEMRVEEVRKYIEARATAACETPKCPPVIGSIKSCYCGKTLRNANHDPDAKYCCSNDKTFRLSIEVCKDVTEHQTLLSKEFGAAATLRGSGTIVPYKLSDTASVNINKALIPRLESVRQRLRGVEYGFKQDFAVGFNLRPVSGSPDGHGVFSTHAYGIAIDLNWDKNPYCPLFPSVGRCNSCESALVTDLPPQVVAAFEESGFTWGGRWPVPDPMHFEFTAATAR